MQSMLINRRDLDFLLHELLQVENLCFRERYREHSRETFDAVIDTALKIAEEKFAPHARKADEHEPRFEDGRVVMIPEVADALKAFADAGFISAGFDAELGGMQLPVTVAQAALALFFSANVGTAAYPMLTIGNANLIRKFGTDAQRATYLPHLLSGRFSGTMCLSEPQAGSSLSDIVTRAEPQPDGTYRLFGQKMWISAGDHELTENIVHLVLAKIPGGPPGVKGISLFLVPKRLKNADGSVGERNDVALAGLNHKMGYRGTTNCVLNFGEQDGAVGTLVGEMHKGLACMFHMMNEARIGVGLGAVMLGYAGYEASLAYARQRSQGRSIGPSGKDPASAPQPIIEHADVKRMLLAQKSYVEGGLALELYCARLVDELHTGEPDAAREAGTLLEVLTPIAKSWPSEWCLEANSLAIQVHGGYGYTRDFMVEQYWRDNRLNMIHEGTHGIQGLDLLGRKVVMDGGAGLKLLAGRISTTIERAGHESGLAEPANALAAALQRLGSATKAAWSTGQPEEALANATPYLQAFGHVVLAWLWLDVAMAARRAGSTLVDGKLAAMRYFFAYELPRIDAWLAVVASREAVCREMRDEWF